MKIYLIAYCKPMMKLIWMLKIRTELFYNFKWNYSLTLSENDSSLKK